MSEEASVQGEEVFKMVEVLNPTNLKILQLLSKEQLDVSTIAIRLELSEAYVSTRITLLEEMKLIRVYYERGKRGVRKICETVVRRIIIILDH